MRRLLASFFLCLVFATAAKANCYVLQNNTDEDRKWSFSYDTEIGPGQLRTVTIAPHDHYPTEGQWCWDRVPWKAVVRVASGDYRRSWSGAFTMGDGNGASPSGTYSLEPAAQTATVAKPAPRSRPKGVAVSGKIEKAEKAERAARAGKASRAEKVETVGAGGSAPSISCVEGACGVLFQNGRVAYTDTNQPTAGGGVAIAGFKAPGSISCTAQAGPSGGLCVVVDSTGQTWKGPMRPGAGTWAPWTKPPQD